MARTARGKPVRFAPGTPGASGELALWMSPAEAPRRRDRNPKPHGLRAPAPPPSLGSPPQPS